MHSKKSPDISLENLHNSSTRCRYPILTQAWAFWVKMLRRIRTLVRLDPGYPEYELHVLTEIIRWGPHLVIPGSPDELDCIQNPCKISGWVGFFGVKFGYFCPETPFLIGFSISA